MKGLVAFMLLVCAVGTALWVADVLPISGRKGRPIQPLKPAASQAEAIKLAKKEDLPTIEHATKVIVRLVVNGWWSFRNERTIESEAMLKQIREAMTICETGQSARDLRARLEFYRGDRLLRIVDVSTDGQWGIMRPNHHFYVVGRNRGLADIVNQLFERVN
jgi:hypothetical protein